MQIGALYGISPSIIRALGVETGRRTITICSKLQVNSLVCRVTTSSEAAVVTRHSEPAMARDLADFHEFPASDTPSTLARSADLSRQNAAPGYFPLAAAFLDDLRRHAGENRG